MILAELPGALLPFDPGTEGMSCFALSGDGRYLFAVVVYNFVDGRATQVDVRRFTRGAGAWGTATTLMTQASGGGVQAAFCAASYDGANFALHLSLDGGVTSSVVLFAGSTLVQTITGAETPFALNDDATVLVVTGNSASKIKTYEGSPGTLGFVTEFSTINMSAVSVSNNGLRLAVARNTGIAIYTRASLASAWSSAGTFPYGGIEGLANDFLDETGDSLLTFRSEPTREAYRLAGGFGAWGYSPVDTADLTAYPLGLVPGAYSATADFATVAASDNDGYIRLFGVEPGLPAPPPPPASAFWTGFVNSYEVP